LCTFVQPGVGVYGYTPTVTESCQCLCAFSCATYEIMLRLPFTSDEAKKLNQEILKHYILPL
jgi:hypothetical protein